MTMCCMSQRAFIPSFIIHIHRFDLCADVISEDLLTVEGMDMKLMEPITAAHLINAARLGNSKAEAVLNKGQSQKRAHTYTQTILKIHSHWL